MEMTALSLGVHLQCQTFNLPFQVSARLPALKIIPAWATRWFPLPSTGSSALNWTESDITENDLEKATPAHKTYLKSEWISNSYKKITDQPNL